MLGEGEGRGAEKGKGKGKGKERETKEVAAPQWTCRGNEAVLDMRLTDDDLRLDVTVAYPGGTVSSTRRGRSGRG